MAITKLAAVFTVALPALTLSTSVWAQSPGGNAFPSRGRNLRAEASKQGEESGRPHLPDVGADPEAFRKFMEQMAGTGPFGAGGAQERSGSAQRSGKSPEDFAKFMEQMMSMGPFGAGGGAMGMGLPGGGGESVDFDALQAQLEQMEQMLGGSPFGAGDAQEMGGSDQVSGKSPEDFAKFMEQMMAAGPFGGGAMGMGFPRGGGESVDLDALQAQLEQMEQMLGGSPFSAGDAQKKSGSVQSSGRSPEDFAKFMEQMMSMGPFGTGGAAGLGFPGAGGESIDLDALLRQIEQMERRMGGAPFGRGACVPGGTCGSGDVDALLLQLLLSGPMGGGAQNSFGFQGMFGPSFGSGFGPLSGGNPFSCGASMGCGMTPFPGFPGGFEELLEQMAGSERAPRGRSGSFWKFQ